MKLLSISGKQSDPRSGSDVLQKKVKLVADEDEEDDDDFDDESTKGNASIKKSV